MKRKKKVSKANFLSVAVDPHIRKQLEAVAEAEHRNLSQTVRIALDEFLQRRRDTAAA